MSENIETPTPTRTPSWPVAEAKAQLSEVLRRARSEGPQRIGARKPCVVVAEEDWKRLTGQQPRLGSWLVKNLRGVGEIELPPRDDPPRPIPFEDA